MNISEIAHRTVTHCTDRDTLDDVAALLWRANIGCLPVLADDDRLVGMITDRDIAIAAFLQGAPLRSITVSSVMSKEVASANAHDPVETVLAQMSARRLRRMPVIDDSGRLVGIVSLNDIARAALARQLPSISLADIVAVVASPRSLAATRP